MPDFTFTSPEGKNYTVQGPEGATKEQAYQMLQQQLEAKTAKPDAAATPEATGKGQQTISGAASDIGVSGVVGGALGALAPEITTGLGVASMAIPVVGEVVGPALIAAGSAMRTARVAEMAAGALSGLASEGAGQVADAAGASPLVGAATRIVGGMASPGAAEIAGYVSKTAKAAWNVATRLAGAEPSIPAAVTKAKELLSDKILATQPQLDLHAALQQGVAHDTQAADDAARAHVAEAHAKAAKIAATDEAAAQRVIDDARVHGDALRDEAAKRAEVLGRATDGKLQTASRVKALADKELLTVGTPKEMSDIGNSLRSKITGEQQKAITERNAAYQATVGERDAAVAAKESAGVHVDSLPETKALKDEIAQKLLLTKKGREAAQGKAAVTDPGVQSAYQRIYDSVSNRRVQTGVNPDTGAPTYQTFKTTFDALDHVRRKLGDVAFGKEAEGYSALGQNLAKDMYGKISTIQEKFAGPAQKELQTNYSQGTQGLTKFGTAAGKKATAVDRMDPEAFTKDPAAIPQSYFHSQQGVKDLKELTNDPALVANAAHDYVARQLAGKSSAQAQAWLKAPAQTDWMREVPGLSEKATAYAGKVEQIERVSGGLEKKATAFAAEKAKTTSDAALTADKVMSDARKDRETRLRSRSDERGEIVKSAGEAAASTRNAVVEKAQAVVKAGFPAEATRRLLMSGTPEELQQATRYLAGTPGGKAALDGSVRSVLKELSQQKLEQTWNERLLPMLREGQLVKGGDLAKLQQDVNYVLRAYEGKAARTLTQKLVTAALGSAGGTAAARVKDAVEN